MTANVSPVSPRNRIFASAGRSLLRSISGLWKFLAVLAIFAILVSWVIITSFTGVRREHMLYSMHSRAESIGWTVEGSERFLRHGHGPDLQQMLVEISRQPGIAWIALVDVRGQILLDSNTELDGKELYTPYELAQLAPGAELKGRFSPDDPDIYETWKQFLPDRLATRKRGRSAASREPVYLFIALDATDFRHNLQDYVYGLVLVAGLTTLAALCLIALAFYIYNFRESRKKLAVTEALALRVIENYPGALILTDPGGRMTFCNDTGLKLLEIKNGSHLPALADLPFYDWNGILRELASGKPVLEREIDLRINREKRKKAILSAAAIGENGSGQGGYLFVIRDMDEINLLRKKLARSERLSEVGRLAAGLAHEIRNPLSSIRGYANYLSTRLENDPMGKATSMLLVDETTRINNVLTELLFLARPPELRLSPQALQPILKKVYLLAKPDAEAKDIVLELDMPQDEAPLPEVDADRLLQALLNLALNAIQASGNGCTVRLCLAKTAKDELNFRWLISVEDNGPGMTEEVRRQIFTPYFTTKDTGTGLGLSITRQIVEGHNGDISVVSAPGKGTIFSIYLPAINSGNQT